MRTLFACGMLIIAGLTGGALAPTAVDAAAATRADTTPAAHPPAAHTPAPRTPAAASHATARPGGTAPVARIAVPRAASLAPRPIGVPAGAHVQPSHAPKASAPPAPLAARPRPGKNAPTTLGGPAKYDAKKGAMLGGNVMPHRP
jgi:hypothetical protein